jgi:hypothetical protein
VGCITQGPDREMWCFCRGGGSLAPAKNPKGTGSPKKFCGAQRKFDTSRKSGHQSVPAMGESITRSTVETKTAAGMSAPHKQPRQTES